VDIGSNEQFSFFDINDSSHDVKRTETGKEAEGQQSSADRKRGISGKETEKMKMHVLRGDF
jgi:hypothetical protein